MTGRGLRLLELSFIIGVVADVLVEVAFHRSLLGGSGFAVGVIMRTGLITIFSFSYFYACGEPTVRGNPR